MRGYVDLRPHLTAGGDQQKDAGAAGELPGTEGKDSARGAEIWKRCREIVLGGSPGREKEVRAKKAQ